MTGVRALTIKLLRDLRRLWAQAAAIALVLAAGVATLILSSGALQSLTGTRASYYESNRFADVFANATRAPKDAAAAVALIEGVAAVELRVSGLGIADIPGLEEPATLRLISLPDHHEPELNRLTLRRGRLPEPEAIDEAVISENFGKAHGLLPGQTFSGIVNGMRRDFRVTGWAISPEFVYAIGPGELMPDAKRFGVVWQREKVLSADFGQRGAFNDLAVKLLPGAKEKAVIAQIDRILRPFGGRGAFGRKYHLSHAFLDAELQQLAAMQRILPPIFLLVAAFLVNMTLSRLIALEREQVGLLKAMGYSSAAVARHYVAFVSVIALCGSAIGLVAGWWLGHGLALMYARFFNFPTLLFSRDPQIYGLAVVVAVAAAVAGAARAALAAARLSPAVAMAPPSPPLYRQLLGQRGALLNLVRQPTVMNIRHLAHWPGRTISGVIGVALAVAILAGSLWSAGAISHVVDITFNRMDRQDATIQFPQALNLAAYFSVRRLPGVMQAEPFRSEDVEISFNNKYRRISLTGRPGLTRLSRLLDEQLNDVALPPQGVMLTEALASVLGVHRGDTVSFTFLDRNRERIDVAVSAVTQSYFGLGAYMDMGTLNGLLHQDALVSGVNISFDSARRPELLAALKAMPVTRFVVFQKLVQQHFKETLAQNITIMMTVYVSLASIVAFGVIYNFARVSLSEQGRELASLRVMGFSRAEVSSFLLSELAVIVVVAQPFGWLIGTGFAYAMTHAFSSELYRVPLIISRSVYAYASLIVIAAAAISALIVRRRIDGLDMVAVLKTRE